MPRCGQTRPMTRAFAIPLPRIYPHKAEESHISAPPAGAYYSGVEARARSASYVEEPAVADADARHIPALLGYSRLAAIRQSGWMPTSATADWSDDHHRGAATRGSR